MAMIGPGAGPQTLEETLKLGNSDLRFTFERNEVPEEVQAQFFTHGVTNVNKFSAFFKR